MDNLKQVTNRGAFVLIMAFVLTITIGITGQLPVNAQVATNDFITVYPTPNTEYFTNPGIGWQRMEYNNPPLLSESVVYPTREDISWQALNPNPGEYNWALLDGKIATATNNNQLFSFRVYTMQGEGWGGHHVPQWVVNRDRTIIQGGSPNYANCTYQTYWSTFVDALRVRYDGDNRIAFIDISGYGNFNEWSWTDGQTVWDDSFLAPSSVDGMARIRLADMFIGGSDSSHLCIGSNGAIQTTTYNYTGFQSTQLVMPYAGIQQTTRYVASRRDDVGIRYDCLGRNETASTDILAKIGDVIESTWRTAPIIFEFCSNLSTSADMIARADELLNATHGVIVHENLEDPRDEAPVRNLMTNVGYRYQLTQAVYDSAVSTGDPLSFTMSWQNVGTSPAYPSMGYDFELHTYLINSSGNVVLDHVSNSDVSSWMPAHPLPGTAPSNAVGELINLPDSLVAGTYQLRVAIVNVNTGDPINLAIQGDDLFGRYFIGEITVSGDASAPVQPTATITPTQSQPIEPQDPAPRDPADEPTPEPTVPVVEPTDEPTPEPISGNVVFVGNADPQAWVHTGTTWAAYIDIRIEDSDGNTPSDVTVTGMWSDGTPYSCVTNGGWCGARLLSIPNSEDTIALDITSLQRSNWAYDANANKVESPVYVSFGSDQPTPAPTSNAQPTSAPPTAVPPSPTPMPTVSSGGGQGGGGSTSTNGYVHVSNIDAQSWNEGRGTWAAYVDITVVDESNRAISGVTVTARWDDGTTFTCTTSGGWCGTRRDGIRRSQSTATFTIVSLSHPTKAYNASANSDPQQGGNNNRASDGTTIIISR